MAAKKADGPVQVNLRVAPDMAEALDAWIEEANRGRSWPKVTRTDVIRNLIKWGLQKRPEWALEV